MKWRTGFLAMAIACGATPLNAGPDAGPFLGLWTVTDAKPAPWKTPAGPANATLLNAKIAFDRRQLEGPAPFACAKAVYWTESRTPETLFSGNLSDPQRQARELGFGSKIMVVSIGCQGGETTTAPDVALIDVHTAMFALDDYIYVMKR